jgi:hypothetical protein
MSSWHFLLAQLEVKDVVSSWKTAGSARNDYLIVFGVAILVTLLIVLWAVFLRKPSRKHHARHPTQHHSPPIAASTHAVSSGPASAALALPKRRRGRRHRDRRPRNPTLAQTGGLPPIRTGGPPESLL